MIDISEIKIVRSNRRTMALHLMPDGTIEVRAPSLMPKFFINDFIYKNSAWIEKRIGKVQKRAKKRQYIEREKFLYLGNEYELKIGNYVRIEIREDKLLFPLALKFRAQKELENWYKFRAKELITSQVTHYAKEMNTSYADLRFSDTSSKWGSCTHDNRLQFNWRLIMAPLLVLRYVIIHELTHTLEKNHSHKFWARVSAFNPSYKQQIKWLKTHGDTLNI